jgi:transcriptional regulator with XRE-family HTH domain
MKRQKRLRSYLRSFRLRWGFSQRELAFILGLKTKTAISQIERHLRRPKLAHALALYILFGAYIYEMFPALFTDVEEAVLTRAYDLYERLQGQSSKKVRAKLDFLEEVFSRAKLRRRGAEST